METTLDLRALRPGERAAVSAIHHEHAMSQRLMQLGFVPGTQVTCVGTSPAGDPAAYLVRGAVIALRGCDAARIEIGRPAPAEGCHG